MVDDNYLYIGKKGYTIPKAILTVEQEKRIRDELTITPKIHGVPNTKPQGFPVYRESNNKIYVPHYYGVEHYGNVDKVKIKNGEDITLEFKGSLRDNQKGVVSTYLDHVSKTKIGGGLLELPCAFGKTVLSLNIISELKKKTLIIVHKEFLMNQWIERIAQFLPKARIGKIQGQVIDIDDKDIVIGMLQSLSMKEYPSTIFDSFGLTIIDEVHHISSEVFSKTLFKIITKYMLGLSATMDRKDGTTFVFKMFLGPVVFKGARDSEHKVVVKGIEYKTEDEEFNEVKYDYRGNPAYSSMISKLCDYNRRSEFILTVLGDLLKDTSSCKQIMILAHNKCLLKYLYDAISHRNMATVGYYLGGMKQAALKETEGKKIVIATYAMAAEALDIKTLTTLIMATPKTDIEQSVGRILREKHSSPLVIDIIDSHGLFQNQWRKRKTFYRRENYKILYTDSNKYCIDNSSWKLVFQPNDKRKINTSTVSRKKNCSVKSNTSDNSITEDSEDDNVSGGNGYDSDNNTGVGAGVGKCLLTPLVKKI